MVYDTQNYWFLGHCSKKLYLLLFISVSGLCMLYHNLYCTILLLLPIESAWSQLFTDISCPVTWLALSKGTNRGGGIRF
jgi:hypothetical protein